MGLEGLLRQFTSPTARNMSWKTRPTSVVQVMSPYPTGKGFMTNMFTEKLLFYVTSGHGDHEEVDGIPVGEGLGTGELGKISRIFQLKEKCYTRLRSLQLMDRISDQVNNSSTS